MHVLSLKGSETLILPLGSNITKYIFQDFQQILEHRVNAIKDPVLFMHATESYEALKGRMERIHNNGRPLKDNEVENYAGPEAVHVAKVNDRVKAAMLRKYVGNPDYKWFYGAGNPAEAVGEVFSALMNNREVPLGLAAVYVAYGGMQTGNIKQQLERIFDGEIPTITQPEHALSYIKRDR